MKNARLHFLNCAAFSAVIAFSCLTPTTALAAEEAEPATGDITINIDMPITVEAGVTPTSVFYWIDIILERINIWLADGTNEEVATLLQYADEKLAEAAELAPTDAQAAAEASERYEKYLKEAVDTASEAQKDGQDVDALFRTISDATLIHIEAFVSLASTAAQLEQPYIDEAFDEITEQEQEIILSIEDDAAQKATIENILSTLEEQRDKIPPEVEEEIKATLDNLIQAIANFVVEQGETLYEQLSDQAKDYLREQANIQLEKAKESIIEEIEELEF
ncbi:DUF5667 domain-containing protein [Patescibacteria group bacterium]